MRSSTSILILASVLPFLGRTQSDSCTTESQPNPIAAQYPNKTTGTVNGTLAILPIPYAEARSVIPPQYGILNDTIKVVLGKDWPAHMFPVLLETRYDHGINVQGISIPDFSGAGVYYPFVDRLSDGYTSFAYQNSQILTASNTIALAGSATYGNLAVPGVFDPPCDAYASDGHGGNKFVATVGAGNTTLPVGELVFSINARPAWHSPYAIEVWQNLTAQPSFGPTLVCDNFVRFFNTSVTTGQYAPKPVEADIFIANPFIPKTTTFKEAWGLQVDNAFIENNVVPCSSLEGYEYGG